MSPFHYIFDKLYPVIRFTYEKVQKHRWYDEITKEVWLGGAPTYKRDYQYLLTQGIRAVVDIRDERSDDLALYADQGINHIKLRVPDMHMPGMDILTEGVDFMKEQIDQGRVVYVHCAKGRGRSAALVAAYLMKHHEMSYEKAKQMLEVKRPLVKLQARHEEGLKAWVATERFKVSQNLQST